MTTLAKVHRRGKCPYCGASDFDETKTEARVPHTHDLMFCDSCDRWSGRLPRNGAQYPLQDPDDKTSSPTVVAHL